jgi:hypothetical protein
MTLQREPSQIGTVGQPTQMLDVNGNPGINLFPSVSIGGATYELLNDADATGDPVGPIVANPYIWTVNGTFGGTTVKLQYLGPDGSTYIDVAGATLSANGSVFIDHVGAGAIIKAVVTGGSPSGLYSSLT